MSRVAQQAIMQEQMAMALAAITVGGAALGAIAYTTKAVIDPEATWEQKVWAPAKGVVVGGVVAFTYPLWILASILAFVARKLLAAGMAVMKRL